MKRTIKLLSFVLALTLLCAAFISCGQTPVDNTPDAKTSETIVVGGGENSGTEGGEETAKPEKVMTLVVGGENEKVYSVDFSDIEITEGGMSILKYLAAQGKLTYKADATGYLTEVGELKQDAASGTYLYIYTSVAKDADTSAYATTKVWSGKTLTSAGVGIDDMTVENGAVIYIGTVKW